ncbi:MAG: hypothetical protein FWC22_01820 [Treponema sp.]|nr:hypothetical protein [Treponema sp.]
MNQKQRISINNNQFMIDGKRIWINGVNTPWNNWNDFGGNYNDTWWDNHFKKLQDAGVNAVRVWINCNNDNGAINIDNNGIITGVSQKHWSDLDQFFLTAERNQKYIKATLISFDHFKNTGKRPAAEKWRSMLKNNQAVMSFADNYTMQFVKRYGGNPRLWSIDICNEPDWIFENPECGQIEWERISYFFAVNAAAIHENCSALVTVGMSFPKYNSDLGSNKGNKLSDNFLQSLYQNKNAYLDFWSLHYYDWLGPNFGVPFYISPYGTLPEGFGLDASKPAVIGECAASGSKGKTAGTENNTIITDYENAYLNGWQGVMPWTSNGVDGCGEFNDLSPAVNHMAQKYKDLIFPSGKNN